jgi:hypothetical protein
VKRRSDRVDLTGKEIGPLTVLESLGRKSPKGQERWRCSCQCGREVVLYGCSLTHPPPIRTCSRSCPLYPKPDPAAMKVRRCWDSAIRHARKLGLPFHRPWRKFEAFLIGVGTAPDPRAYLMRCELCLRPPVDGTDARNSSCRKECGWPLDADLVLGYRSLKF